jgi:hypothetical protein
MSTPQWRALLEQSTQAHLTGQRAKQDSARLLWLGAKAAVKAWRPSTDPTGERLYRRTLIALGGSRKGSASKIKTVALATVEYDLNLDAYGSLNGAYQAAQRLACGEETDLPPICYCPHCTYHHSASPSTDPSNKE